jgi:signal transduction histidine kinase
LKQASLISQLQNGSDYFSHIHRMVYEESSVFFVLLLGSGAVLFWIYLRDISRTRSLQAFFAGVTHEMRTPLTSIRLQTESIQESLDSKNDSRSGILLSRLMQDTLRLEAQVERTLELARVEGGGALYTQPISVSAWLSREIQSWQDAYGARIRIEANLESTRGISIDADPSALQVIIRNMMENSIRHSRKEKVAVAIDAKAEGSQVILSFKDDGEGYSGRVQDLGALFHKGAQSQGAGVGLYLISVLMRRMGGEARFSSEQGFCAKLSFPRGAHGEV